MGRAAERAAEQTEAVARRYFAALAARDADAMAACWKAGGVDRLHGQAELVAPDGVRAYFHELFSAFPDFAVELRSTTADAERCAVRWRARATFAGPGSFQGFAPTGARVAFEAVDVVAVADGLVVGNDAYLDGADVARQLGVLPPRGSRQERSLTALANARAALARRLGAAAPEQVADGVWIVRGGLPRKTMNVYLLEHGDGVVMYDAGVRSMTAALAAAGARMGGVERVVLSHAHHDHRGAAAGLGAPVWCHPAERADVEGDAGAHYMDLSLLDPHGRLLLGALLPRWDGGPAEVAGTLADGDEVAGFRVIELPGHAPGLIGLWREADRLALVSDCVYTLDPQTGRPGAPRVPHAAFNHDTAQARASIRTLAGLRPAAVWTGHAGPLVGDVAGQLERAADAP